ncbi:unnamed protein product [Symbiodinium sp. CCMP2456]|nr:unnamed protein product [Symbiodinium sp. CCMP2456]
MGSAQEPVEQDHGSQTPKRPGSLRSRSAKTSPGASPTGLFVASDIIARLPERHKLDLQVQMHRQADQSAEMLALSRCLLSDDAQPEGWSGTTWLSIVRKELVELDDRLSRQLQRIQSQSDRVMEVVLTSLEEKVAQVMSNQPMMEWRLAELGASVKGLQEQLETQACRTDATEARLQRWKTTIESDMQNLTVGAPVPVQAEPVARSLDAEACRAAVLAELRGSTGGPNGVQESGSAGLHLEDIAAVATRVFGAETATLKDQIAALQEVQDALRGEVARLADRPAMQVDASSPPSLSDRVERAEAAASSQRREELEASVAEVTEVSIQAGPAERAGAKEVPSASEEALAGLEQVQARLEQLEATLEGLPKAVPIMEFQDLQAEVCSSKRRIDSIETAGSSSLERVQEVAAAMAGLKNNIEDLKATAANPAVDMVDIRTSMLKLKTRVDHFESQLQPAKVRSAITRVDRMEAASAACQAQLQQLSGSLEDTKEGMQGWRTTADETLVGLANELHAFRDQVETLEAAHSEAQKEMHLLEAALDEMKESRQPHVTTEFGEDCRAAFQSIGQHTDELQAIKRQLGSLQSEMEANGLNDINGRVEQVEAASAAGNTQLQELAASIGGIHESVKQLEGVVAPLDATMPAAVEAMRKQIVSLQNDIEASRLNDISGRIEHLVSESAAGRAQVQELAASIGGIQESVKQLEGVVSPLDAELPAAVAAMRKQIENVESMEASRLNDISGRVEHAVSESVAGRAQLQELAASFGGIQESVKRLEGVVHPLDAELPAAVEAMRKQMNVEAVQASRLNDISGRVEHVVSESAAGRVQVQELAASIGGIQESVKQLEGVVSPLDAELPAAVAAMRKQIENVESMEASRLNDISGRVEHAASESAAGRAQLQELAASFGDIQESVKRLEGVVHPLDAELPAAVEAMRKQMDNVESMQASRLNDISVRVEHVVSDSAAGRAQLQELAASIGGIQESVKQLEGVVSPLDAELPAAVAAMRKQIENVESMEASRLNDISGRVEHAVSESVAGRAQLQELAASFGGIQESVKRLEGVVHPLDAELPAAVEAMRKQMDNAESLEASRLNDISGRVERVVLESAAGRAQLQELAASIGCIQESFKQLEGVVVPLDATMPAAVEAMRKQIVSLQNEIEANRLHDASGRVGHLEAASAAGRTQMQDLASSVDGINESVRQLKQRVTESDAEVPAAVEAIRLQIDKLQLAMEANSLNDAGGADEATSSGHLQELLAASIDGIRESVRLLQQLRHSVAEPDAELTGQVEAVKKQMDKLLLEMEANKLKDVNSSVQMQELAATVDGIRESVKQLRSVVGLHGGELPETSGPGVQVDSAPLPTSPCRNLSAALHEISARVDHVESAALARQDRLEQLTGDMASIAAEVQQLEAITGKPGSSGYKSDYHEASAQPLTTAVADVVSRVAQVEHETSTRRTRMQEIYSCVQELQAQIEKLEANIMQPAWRPQTSFSEMDSLQLSPSVAPTVAADTVHDLQTQVGELEVASSFRHQRVHDLTSAVDELRTQLQEVCEKASAVELEGRKLTSEVEDVRLCVDRLERQRQQAASGQSVEAGPLVLDAAAKSWMDRQVAHVLDRAADNFVSLLETTNRRLDAAITKQESVNEELQHSTSKGPANDDVVQLLHSLRQEHRLEAAALWDGLADLADHLGADAGRFMQAGSHVGLWSCQRRGR